MKFGVLLKSLNKSQVAYSITYNLNSLAKEHEPIVFYSLIDRPSLIPLFCHLNMYHAWAFNHPVIATSLKTAEYLLSFPGPTTKFLYVWDCEWMYDSNPQFSRLANVYLNPNLELIARSSYHYDIISKCWKKPITIIEDFHYEQIIHAIS